VNIGVGRESRSSVSPFTEGFVTNVVGVVARALLICDVVRGGHEE